MPFFNESRSKKETKKTSNLKDIKMEFVQPCISQDNVILALASYGAY